MLQACVLAGESSTTCRIVKIDSLLILLTFSTPQRPPCVFLRRVVIKSSIKSQRIDEKLSRKPHARKEIVIGPSQLGSLRAYSLVDTL